MDDERLDFELRVSPDKMLVELSCRPCLDSVDPLHAAILERIGELGLVETPRKRKLEEWLRMEATPEPKAVQVVLYEGRRPTPSRDGRIQWEGNFFEPGFCIDAETGAIDYRQRNAEDAVEEDQLLARLIAPEDGQDGIDVFGKRVKAATAKKVKIVVGKNVERRGDDRYYATKSGKVRWVSDCLTVDDVLYVKGDVGLETGNIHQTGAIVVRGDVQEGATIDVEGDMEVKGVLGASNVNVGGNLVVRGGIKGAADWRVAVAGNVYAKYILDGNLEAGGDVVVQNEIMHSNVGARGSVLIPKGRIVGGTVTALGGITAGEIGNDAEVKTIIMGGIDCAPADDQDDSEADASTGGRCFAVIRTEVYPNSFFRMGSGSLRVAKEQKGPVQVVYERGKVDIQTGEGAQH